VGNGLHHRNWSVASAPSRSITVALTLTLLVTLLPGVTLGATSQGKVTIHQSNNRIVREKHAKKSTAAAAQPAAAPAPAAAPTMAPAPQPTGAPGSTAPKPQATPAEPAAPEPTPSTPVVEPAGAPFTFRWETPTRAPSAGFNRLTAGGVRTVKFSLGGDHGLTFLAPGYPKSQRIDCSTAARVPHTQSSTTAFGTPLTYDATTGIYTYAWQTRQSWSSTCRQFVLKLSDGSLHKANYAVTGFHFSAPLLAYPGINPASAGAVLAVRFKLGGDAIFRGLTPRSVRIDCTTGAIIGGRTKTQPQGVSSLTRDPVTHEYTYNWQTKAIWAQTCRRFELRLRDGSVEALSLQFNRAPDAVNDSGTGFTTDEATAFTTANVLANDSDADGDSFSLTGMNTGGTVGAVTNNGDGTFAYNPGAAFNHLAAGAHATDTFSYTITDAHGATDSATVTITVKGLNDAPTNLALSNASVPENQPVNTVMGTLSSTDADSADAHTYSLVSGTGDDDNASFNIAGASLRTSATFNYESRSLYLIRVQTNDGHGGTFQKQLTVTVTNVNEQPTDIGLSNATIAENQPVGTLVGTLTTADPDSPDPHTYSLVDTGCGGAAHPGNSSFVIGTGPDADKLKTGSAIDYEATPSLLICVRTTDGGSLTFDEQFAIDVTNTGEPPVVTTSGGSTLYTEGTGTPIIDNGVTVTDVDSANLVGATVTIQPGSIEAGDVLGFSSPQNGISGTYNSGTGVLTLTGNVAKGFYETALRSVTFSTSNDNPSATRTIDFQVNDGALYSTFATKGITITPVNDAPVTDLNGTGTIDFDTTASFFEDSPAVSVAPSADLSDVDSANLSTATITLTNVLDPTTETLSVSVTGTSISASAFDSGTGLLTLSGSDTVAHYQQVIRTLKYDNTSNTPNTTSRDISIKVNDGALDSNVAHSLVSVTAHNDAPVANNQSGLATDEETPLGITLTGSDPEGSAITFASDQPSHGSVSPTNSFSVTYTPTANYCGPDSFTFHTRDGSVDSANGTVSITVNCVNDAPVNSIPPPQSVAQSTSLVMSGANAIQVSDVDVGAGTLSITLAISNGTLTLDGTAGLSFTVGGGSDDTAMAFTGTQTAINNALDGASFNASATPATGSIQIITNDQGQTGSGGAKSDTDTATITVTPPNSAPTSTAPASISTDEDTSFAFTPGTVTVADTDSPTLAVTLTVTNGTLSMNGATLGALTFTTGDGTNDATMTFSGSPANLNLALATLTYTPTLNYNGADTLTFSVSDSIAAPVVKVVAITINPVNDAPVLSDTNLALTAENEDAPAPGGTVGTLVSSLVSATNVSDPDTSPAYGIAITAVTGGGTWWYSINDGTNWTSFSPPSAGAAQLVAATNGRIYYQPAPNVNGTLSSAITFRAWDTTSGTNGLTADTTTNGGATPYSSATDTASIDVTAVNDAPSITVPVAQSATEDVPKVFSSGNSNQISISDIDVGAGTLQVTLSVANGTLTLSGVSGLTFSFSDANGTGAGDGAGDATMTFRGTQANVNAALNGLSFLSTLDYNGADTLSVSTKDLGNTGSGGSLSDSDSVALTITAANDAPVNSIPGTQTFNEDNSRTFSAANSNAITVSDVDAGAGTLTVSLTTTAGTLTLGTTAGVTGVTGNGTGTVSATGTISALNTALDGLIFAPTLNLNGAQTIGMSTNDNGNTGTPGPQSDADNINLSITAVNDAPSLTVPGSQTTAEDIAKVFSPGNSNPISVSDADAGGNSVQVTLSVVHGTLTLSTTAGLSFSFSDANGTSAGDGTADALMRFRGPISNVNAALNGLSYNPAANFNDSRGSESLSAVVNDLGNTGTGGALTDSDNVAISVTAVADAPVAAAKAFNVGTNLTINLTGLLTGASDPDDGDNSGAFVSTYTLTSVTIGSGTCSGCTISNVSNISNGSADVDPPADTTGSLTINYTINDSGNPGGGQTSAAGVITLSISGPTVWFVSPSGSDSNKGTLGSPFLTLGKADTVDATGDGIFLYSGTYSQGIALNSSEKLVGQGTTGTDFDTVFGLTGGNAPPAGTKPRPSLALTRPTVANTITLESNVSVRGLDIASTANTGMADPAAAITGVAVSELGVTTTSGTAVLLSDIAGTLTFDHLTTSSNGAGASLTDGAGTGTNSGATFSFSSVSISSGGNAGFTATGGGTVNVTGSSNTLSTAAGTPLNVANTTIGASGMTFSSITTSGSTGNGVVLNTTGSGNFTVTGTTGLTMAAGSSVPLSITTRTGGTVSFGTINVVSRRATGIFLDSVVGTATFGATTIANPQAAGGYGIRVEDSSAAVTFASATISDPNVTVAQDDSDSNGIPNNEGDGDGIFLTNNTGSFTLNGGTISNPGNDGIDVRNSLNLVLSNVTITNTGVDTAFGDPQGDGGHGIWANNLKGTSSITGGTISHFDKGNRDGMLLLNDNGTLTITVQGTHFQDSIGNEGLFIGAGASAIINATLGGATNNVATNVTFSNILATALQASAGTGAAGSAGTVNLTVQNSTFQSSPLDGKTNFIASNVEAGKLSLNVLNNTFSNVFVTASTGEALLSFSADGTLAGNTFGATIQGNNINGVGTSASNCAGGAVRCLGPGNAILVFIDDSSSVPNTILIDNNTIVNTQQGAIYLDLANLSTAPNAVVNAKVINNCIGKLRVGSACTGADAPVGAGAGLANGRGIVVERRRNGSHGGNVLISGNLVRNGVGQSAGALNTPGIFVRTKADAHLDVTITNNNVDTNFVGAAEMRLDTNANDAGDVLAPTQCDDISGNSFPAGASASIDINEVNGTHNVEQASAASVSLLNGSATVTADAGVTFGVACAAPPP
jgi:VCBS repeat-containing protein